MAARKKKPATKPVTPPAPPHVRKFRARVEWYGREYVSHKYQYIGGTDYASELASVMQSTLAYQIETALRHAYSAGATEVRFRITHY